MQLIRVISFYNPVTIDDNSLHDDDSCSFSVVQLCITNQEHNKQDIK